MELLGRASYNIFLVQMVYYCDIAPKAYTFVESRAMQFIMNIMVCIIAGILFYFVESKITKVMIHITEPIMIRIENKIESMK